MQGISKAAGGTENKRGFNGNELQNKEFSDGSGLDAYDFNARTYDQQVGRFLQVDPLPEDGDQESFTPYQFGLDNPVRYDDPDGKCPLCGLIGAGVGALVGGGIEIASQLYQHGEVNNWSAVGGATVQGIVTGGVAGLTGGASLAVTVSASAGANVVGGAVNNIVQGKAITAGSVVKDAAVGAVAGVGGKLLDKGVNAVLSKGETTATEAANKVISPNVQKALNTLNEIKAEGGTVKVNPLKPNQELNMTIQKADSKIDLRVETHKLPPKYGGDGITPMRHMNVDLKPKANLPNNGHKILE